MVENKKSESQLSDSIRKRWFQVITFILQKQGINVDKAIIKKFADDLKEQFFHLKEEIIDGKLTVIPYVSIMNVPDEKVKEVIEILIDRYSRLGIDFKEIL